VNGVRHACGLCDECLAWAANSVLRGLADTPPALQPTMAVPASSPRREGLRAMVRPALVATMLLLALVAGGVMVASFQLARPAVRLGPRAWRTLARAGGAPAVVPAAVPVATAVAATVAAEEEPLPWPPNILSGSGVESHDPSELLARARRLASAGLDLTVTETRLSPAAFRDGLAGLALHGDSSAVRAVRRHGALIGMRFEGVRPGSLLGLAGLQSGDIVTAVNGHRIAGGESPGATGGSGVAGAAVIEVLRGPRRVVLATCWQCDEPAPHTRVARAR
jgi:membrane-associated protease RseP (regulator of RpoE activity)